MLYWQIQVFGILFQVIINLVIFVISNIILSIILNKTLKLLKWKEMKQYQTENGLNILKVMTFL